MSKQDEIVNSVKSAATWWIKRRTAKILESEHDTMEINPFLAPLIYSMHGLENAQQLSDFVTAGHFYIGHGTGFGKLIDEKILPSAFATEKLSKAYRQDNDLLDSAFDDIDHVVTRGDDRYLLSLKASRWTIQLGQASKLNSAFHELIKLREAGAVEFKKIIVGVFYGHGDDLTDKYRLVRGISEGANHDVIDITEDVEVRAGRDFWSWLGDDNETQRWIMSGIYRAIAECSSEDDTASGPAKEVERELTGMFAKIGDLATEEDCLAFIDQINR